MFSSLLATLFPPQIPRCPGTGSKLLSARRRATDEKYTARPLDHFPNPLVSKVELDRARAEGGVLDGMFRKYKREAECQGERVRKRCEECGDWCCNVSSSFFSFSGFFCLLGRGVLWRGGVRSWDLGTFLCFWFGFFADAFLSFLIS